MNQTHKLTELTCLLHPGKTLEHICVSENCKQRYGLFCSMCDKQEVKGLNSPVSHFNCRRVYVHEVLTFLEQFNSSRQQKVELELTPLHYLKKSLVEIGTAISIWINNIQIMVDKRISLSDVDSNLDRIYDMYLGLESEYQQGQQKLRSLMEDLTPFIELKFLPNNKIQIQKATLGSFYEDEQKLLLENTVKELKEIVDGLEGMQFMKFTQSMVVPRFKNKTLQSKVLSNSLPTPLTMSVRPDKDLGIMIQGFYIPNLFYEIRLMRTFRMQMQIHTLDTSKLLVQQTIIINHEELEKVRPTRNDQYLIKLHKPLTLYKDQGISVSFIALGEEILFSEFQQTQQHNEYFIFDLPTTGQKFIADPFMILGVLIKEILE